MPASAINAIATSDVILCNIDDDSAEDPSSVMEPKRSQYWGKWLSAMHKELESLKAKGIYEEVESLPLNRKAVQCKWVLYIKRNK